VSAPAFAVRTPAAGRSCARIWTGWRPRSHDCGCAGAESPEPGAWGGSGHV